MLARALMTKKVAMIAADETTEAATQLMRTRGVGMLPVVERLDRPRLLGVIADRDIVGQMTRFKLRRIPIIDHNHWVVGIIAHADIAIRMGPSDPELIERVVEAISRPGALVR